jgi:gamma-glutamyltranspeptidase/glutathione hydrolase
MHLNNVMGEEDLNPFGFHRHPTGRRMPSMMAPTVVTRGGDVELVLGSAGSNRIRSALLQTIVGVVDHDLDARAAVDAPRVHFEGDVLYVEPGIELGAIGGGDRDGEDELERIEIVHFAERNLFFGGVQAVRRHSGALTGAGDPRRGGVAVSA